MFDNTNPNEPPKPLTELDVLRQQRPASEPQEMRLIAYFSGERLIKIHDRG